MFPFSTFLILTQFTIVSSFSCLSKPMTSNRLLLKSKQTSETNIHTVLTASFQPNEIICNELIIENENDEHINITKESDRRFLKVVLEKVWQEYLIQSDYNFTVPTLKLDCVCDCPGGLDLCNKKHEASNECEPSNKHLSSAICFRKYFYGHVSNGCFLDTDAAEVCCSVTMYRAESAVVYRALYIDSPKTQYKFVIELLDGTGFLLAQSNVSSFDGIHYFQVPNMEDKLNVSLLRNRNFNLEINGHSVTKLVRSTWVYENPITRKIMINQAVDMNFVDETSLSKLGWFKVENKQNRIVHPNEARPALSIEVENCKNDKFKKDWDFNAVGWVKEGEEARLSKNEEGIALKDFYKATVDDVYFEKSSRRIEIVPKNIVAVPISLNLDFSAKLLAYYEESSFERFSAIISVDEYSNRLLFLTVDKGFGSILVHIGDNTSCTVQQIRINLILIGATKWEKSLRLTSCLVGKQLVCLYSLPNRNIYQCKTVQYYEKFFSGPNSRKAPSKSEVGVLDDFKSKSWLDNIWSMIKNLKNKIYGFGISVICGLVLICFIAAFLCCWKNKVLCWETSSRSGLDINLNLRNQEEKNLIV